MKIAGIWSGHDCSFCVLEDGHPLVHAEYERYIREKEVTILELAKVVNKLAKRNFEPVFTPDREYDTLRRRPDITKLKKYVGEHDFVRLDDGVKKTMNWFENKGTR